MLTLTFCGVVQAQTRHTNTGTSSGTAGDYSSYYGYYSGNASTSTGNYNSFFGAYSRNATTTGAYNIQTQE
jgi:hypothetical protein